MKLSALEGLRDVDSPFDDLVVLDYYDGELSGVLVGDGEEFVFGIIAATLQPDWRFFALWNAPLGTAARVRETIVLHDPDTYAAAARALAENFACPCDWVVLGDYLVRHRLWAVEPASPRSAALWVPGDHADLDATGIPFIDHDGFRRLMEPVFGAYPLPPEPEE